jgi:hypothetical protein
MNGDETGDVLFWVEDEFDERKCDCGEVLAE